MNKLGFGFGQILSAPPKWVVAVIAILIILSSIAQFLIAGDPVIKAESQVRILLYLKGFEMFLLAVGALCGVKPTKDEEEIKGI